MSAQPEPTRLALWWWERHYRRGRRVEKIVTWIVWRLPHIFVKWAFYRVLANATSGPFGNESPVDLTWQDAADRWEQRTGGDKRWTRADS